MDYKATILNKKDSTFAPCEKIELSLFLTMSW